jgi:DNA-binding MarR family transcriptional regulator
MEKEQLRLSLNKFLKMYFDACKEVYSEINFDRITKIQFKYLKAIKSMEEPTLTRLSERFNISKPSMNEVITKFEKSGLIVKEKSQLDKRITFLRLTEVGYTLSTTNMLESQRATKKIMDTLSEEEVNYLKTIFDKFGADEL